MSSRGHRVQSYDVTLTLNRYRSRAPHRVPIVYKSGQVGKPLAVLSELPKTFGTVLVLEILHVETVRLDDMRNERTLYSEEDLHQSIHFSGRLIEPEAIVFGGKY